MALSKLDLHFLNMAKIQGQKSSFAKNKRGAILARGNQIVSIGLNTHLDEHMASAKDAGIADNERYVATINAEVDAVGRAIKNGIQLTGVTLYVSTSPNWVSFKFIATLGIRRIVFYGAVSGKRVTYYAQKLGIEIVSVA